MVWAGCLDGTRAKSPGTGPPNADAALRPRGGIRPSGAWSSILDPLIAQDDPTPAVSGRLGRRTSHRAGRRALLLTAFLLALGAAAPAAGQAHRFRFFAGAGLQFFARPQLSLGRGAGLGGSLALRASERLSFETGLFFGRSNRRYTAEDQPVEDVLAEPAYQFRTNRYHLDGSLVFHLGRRQPFQMYLLVGGGVVRRDELREDFVYETVDPPADGEVSQPIGIRRPLKNEVTLDDATYTATAHAGVGFEVYVFDYLSARAEYRIWSPKDFSFRTQQFVIGVNYYK